MAYTIESVGVLVHAGFSLTGNDRIGVENSRSLHQIEENLRQGWDEYIDSIKNDLSFAFLYISCSNNVSLGQALRGSSDLYFAVLEDSQRIKKYKSKLGERLVVMCDYDETYHLVNPRKVLKRRGMVVSPTANLFAFGEFAYPCVEYWKVRSSANLRIDPSRTSVIDRLSMTLVDRSVIATDFLSSYRSLNPG